MPIQGGFSRIAAVIADPAREAILVALSDGSARPAGELAVIAGITAQSASGHLQKLRDAGLLSVWPQGRYRYYRIADEEVAAAIESLAILAGRPRSAPKSRLRAPPEVCFARRCYRHLAGRLGVSLADAMQRKGYVEVHDDCVALTDLGLRWLDVNAIAIPHRTSSLRLCLDWTERRPHLAGTIATAILDHLLENRLLVKSGDNRDLRLTSRGAAWFSQLDIATQTDRQTG
jgi:DNA-binding transcriptional ArsR family regulator